MPYLQLNGGRTELRTLEWISYLTGQFPPDHISFLLFLTYYSFNVPHKKIILRIDDFFPITCALTLNRSVFHFYEVKSIVFRHFHFI